MNPKGWYVQLEKVGSPNDDHRLLLGYWILSEMRALRMPTCGRILQRMPIFWIFYVFLFTSFTTLLAREIQYTVFCEELLPFRMHTSPIHYSQIENEYLFHPGDLSLLLLLATMPFSGSSFFLASVDLATASSQ